MTPSHLDEPIDIGARDQDSLQGLLSSTSTSAQDATGSQMPPVPSSSYSAAVRPVSTPANTLPSTSTATPAHGLGSNLKSANDSKPKKPRKKKDASNVSGESATADTGAKPKKAAKVTKDKAGSNASKSGKARSSVGRSMSRMSSMGRDIGTPPSSQMAGQRATDVDDEQPSAPRLAADDDQNDDEEEEAELDDGVEELGKDHYSTQEVIYAEQQRSMGLLSMIMDEDQLDRHMASRRGALNKTSVRKLVNHVLSQSVSQHVAMVVSGVAKIFVGEMVEKARTIQSDRRETGPLRPTHLREAHRQYYVERERPGHFAPGTNTGFPGLGKRRRMF